MPSKIQVDQIAGATGSTVTLPAGQTLDLSSGTVTLPSAGITTDKLDLISTASVPSVTAKGTPSVSDGYIQLNCEQNSHGIKIKSPPHSAGANYTMVMPNSLGTASQVLRMNSGATGLEFGTVSSNISTSEIVNTTDSFFSTTSMSWTDVTALDTSITPSASNSKLLVFVYLDGAVSIHHYFWNFRLSRKIGAGSFENNVSGLVGNTTGNGGSHRSVRAEYDDNGGSNCFGYFIDSPATTSEVTYRIAVYNGSGGTLYLNRSSSNSTNTNNWQPSAFCKVSIIELKQ